MGCGNYKDNHVRQEKSAQKISVTLAQQATTDDYPEDTYDFPGMTILAIIPGTHELVDLTK